ncbi:hypothetical protein BCR33DRAFT_313428 [Rhizoclosmatium globosum]|uniref:Uncharacterized protein n=1 Tax=Rhizoclosmatium globosum TaxID=329046 RepID=A0A1Y2CZ05_9FUNG|nr:hypothetical protein BCR33DRAFT_313428 [Rhizoclosmatium globosum]|eukprot:ORY52273.1 hypothetical protein BCR33DRAFT_313428 [Rhizoclosmatium globosum]
MSLSQSTKDSRVWTIFLQMLLMYVFLSINLAEIFFFQTHPLLKVAWSLISAGFKMVKNAADLIISLWIWLGHLTILQAIFGS